MSKSLVIQGYPSNNLAQQVDAVTIQQAKKGIVPQRRKSKLNKNLCFSI
jgi:hypothetical protein